MSQILYVYESWISFHSTVPGLGVKNKHAPKQFIDSAWSMIRKSKTPSQVPGPFKKELRFSKWCWNLEPPQLNERTRKKRIPHSSGEKAIYLKSPPRFVVSFLQIHHSSRIYYYCFFFLFEATLQQFQIINENTDGWPWNHGRNSLIEGK